MSDKYNEMIARYQKLFSGRCTYIECCDGWFSIINRLCLQLQYQTDFHGAPQLVVAQVKEKFGGLRFYVDGSPSERQLACIERAERLCDSACEVCGKPGVVRQGSWIKTLCDEHADGRKPLDYEEGVLQ